MPKGIYKRISGRQLTADHRAKISRALLGRKMSVEAIEKIRQANLGKKRSDEARENMRTAHLGERHTAEHTEKIRRANLGRKRTAEACANISKAKLGKRRTAAAIATKSGERSHFWRGGISASYSPEFNEVLRVNIRNRDDHLCQNPKCYLPQNGRAHPVHHIDFNKGNSDPTNLITLCSKCHNKTTDGRRDHWTEYYQALQVVRGIGATMELRA